jgi:protein-serine/threonine kinase
MDRALNPDAPAQKKHVRCIQFSERRVQVTTMEQMDKATYAARFQVIHEVGAGAFGRVEKVYDRKTRQVRAIKIILFGDAPEELEEVKLLQQLKHQNIVQFHESFAVDREFMILMEFCSNGNIAQLKPLINELLLLAIIRDLASALAHIHERSLIHFDVKPQNVLLSSIGEIRLSDFGISRRADSATVQKQCGKPGTVLYMSPEMLQGKPATSAVDIWSLGITAFEMAVGVPIGLTDCKNFDEWLSKNEHVFAADGQIWSSGLKKLIAGMLERNASKRTTAKEILELPIIKDCPPTWLLTGNIIEPSSEVFWEDD